MDIPHDVLLASLQSLYDRIADLPDEVPAGASGSDYGALAEGVQQCVGELAAAKAWEAARPRTVKLAREALAALERRETIEAAVKDAKRALADARGKASGKPLPQFVSVLGQMVRDAAAACKHSGLEAYVGDEDASGATVMIYTALFVLDVVLEEVDDSSRGGGPRRAVRCGSCKLQVLRGADTVENDATNAELLAAANGACVGQPGRLFAVLTALARAAAAAAVLSSSQSGAGAGGSGGGGGSADGSGSSAGGFRADVEALLGGSLAALADARLPASAVAEGLAVALWPPPCGASSSTASSGGGGDVVVEDGDDNDCGKSGGRLPRAYGLRLSPAHWRRRSALAAVLDPPLALSAPSARRLFGLALGQSPSAGAGAGGVEGGGGLSAAAWQELLDAGCVTRPGSRALSGGSGGGGSGGGDGGSSGGNSGSSSSSSSSNGGGGSSGGGGGYAETGTASALLVAEGWLGGSGVHCAVSTVGPPRPWTVGNHGGGVRPANDCNGSSQVESAPGSGGGLCDAAGCARVPRVAGLAGGEFLVLKWLPVVVRGGRGGGGGGNVVAVAHYLRALAAAHALAAPLALALGAADEEEEEEEGDDAGDDDGSEGNSEGNGGSGLAGAAGSVAVSIMPVDWALAAAHRTGTAAPAQQHQPGLLVSLCPVAPLHRSRAAGLALVPAPAASAVRLAVTFPPPPGLAHAFGAAAGDCPAAMIAVAGVEGTAAAVAAAVAAALAMGAAGPPHPFGSLGGALVAGAAAMAAPVSQAEHPARPSKRKGPTSGDDDDAAVQAAPAKGKRARAQ